MKYFDAPPPQVGPWSHVKMLHGTVSLHVQRQQNTGSFDLWCCCLHDHPAAALGDTKLLSLLSKEERKRSERFYFDRHRNLFLLTRLLVRSVLSQYADIPPEIWQFTQTDYGKPEIAPEIAAHIGPGKLRFNVAHTDSFTMCAVSQSGSIGVDVEDHCKGLDLSRVAAEVLAGEELSVLDALPDDERHRAFLRYWVLKEAYAKACGLGVELDWRTIVFRNLTQTEREIRIPDEIPVSSKRWLFKSYFLCERYSVAVAFCPDTVK